MEFITENWYVIIALTAMAGAGGYAVYTFAKMPTEKQLNKIREWLLYAVTKAEKELGGGTGQLKLRYVYDLFVTRFTWVAKIIPFEMFSAMVDEAIDKMQEMLETNESAQVFVSGKTEETKEEEVR